MEASSLRTDEEIQDIYTRYIDMVYRIAFLMLKNSPESEDVSQTVFIKLMQSDNKFKSEEHLKAWLIVTARNTCKDILKSRWWKKTVALDSAVEIPSEEQWEDSSVYKAVMGLHKKYRLPLYLYYYEGYSTQEIADMLAVNPSTLRSQLRAARQKLKLTLEEVQYE